MPVDRVRDILEIAQEPVSLETPIGEEEELHLGDFIPDDDAPEPAEAASFMLLKEQLVEVLKTLTPREEKVLRLRFGIEDGHTRTLEEVGKEFNVTRERIRQIEAKALRKLRHPSRSKKLKILPELTRAAARRSGITRTAVTSKKHRKACFRCFLPVGAEGERDRRAERREALSCQQRSISQWNRGRWFVPASIFAEGRHHAFGMPLHAKDRGGGVQSARRRRRWHARRLGGRARADRPPGDGNR